MESYETYQETQINEHENWNEKNTEDMQKETTSDPLAIASMILGIVSLFFLGIIIGTVGLIFSVISRKKHKNGFNLTGLICSIIGISFNVIMILLYAVIFASIF